MIDANSYAPWAAILLSVISAIYAWRTRRDDKSDAKFSDLDKKIGVRISAIDSDISDVKGRLTKIETHIEDQPTKEDYHKLDLSLVEIKGSLNTLATTFNERFKPISAMAERLQDFFVEESKTRKTRSRNGASE